MPIAGCLSQVRRCRDGGRIWVCNSPCWSPTELFPGYRVRPGQHCGSRGAGLAGRAHGGRGRALTHERRPGGVSVRVDVRSRGRSRPFSGGAWGRTWRTGGCWSPWARAGAADDARGPGPARPERRAGEPAVWSHVALRADSSLARAPGGPDRRALPRPARPRLHPTCSPSEGQVGRHLRGGHHRRGGHIRGATQ